MNRSFLLILFLFAISCKENGQKVHSKKNVEYPTSGVIDRIDLRINSIIPPNAVIEKIAEGLEWSEGPLWIDQYDMLLCSDVKKNRIYKWTEEKGLEIFLEPSGFTGDSTDSRESGSNGLVLDPDGNLVMCQHGNRKIARMEAPLNAPQPKFHSIIDRYNGKRFNSPNDLIYDSKGNLYFTDPPFGLSEEMINDPKKELPFQGIFKYDVKGNLKLMTDVVSRPNGLALSPDEKTMYIANTDENLAVWYAFKVIADTLVEPKIIHDATSLIGKEVGFPDGVKVDKNGNIFTAGPGGIWIFAPEGDLLGKIKPGEWASNCNFNKDCSVLYITADDFLFRVQLKL